MADDFKPELNPVVTSRVLRDYLYSRLRSGANLSLSDKLLGLAMLSRDSASLFSRNAAAADGSTLPPQIIGQLKGHLLNSRGELPENVSLPDISQDYLYGALRGRITKTNA